MKYEIKIVHTDEIMTNKIRHEYNGSTYVRKLTEEISRIFKEKGVNEIKLASKPFTPYRHI